jgi:chemotaxis protein MotA
MFILIGYLVAMGAIFGGFLLGGGHLGALFQPLELLMIGGAAIGAFIAANPLKALKAVGAGLAAIFKPSRYTKSLYMELMALLYEILMKVRKEGFLAIERDIEQPEASALFQKFPGVMKDHHAVRFITDYLRLMASGNLNALEIESLMDSEIETHHHEAEIPAHAVQKIADGLPAFGIVAAVMGVVHTMESLHLPPSELGILIAHALVGTFLGILLSYTIVAPLASMLEVTAAEATKMLQTIKVTLLASLQGYAPALAVEFGRKVLYSTERPGFTELEAHVKQKKAA